MRTLITDDTFPGVILKHLHGHSDILVPVTIGLTAVEWTRVAEVASRNHTDISRALTGIIRDGGGLDEVANAGYALRD